MTLPAQTYTDLLQLVDGTTVVFDFNKRLGTGNPPTAAPLKTVLADLDIGAPVPDREFFDDRILVREDYGPVEMSIVLHCESLNYEFLRQGLGVLARLLKDPKYRIKWARQGAIGTEVRYIHFHSADVEPPQGFHALRESRVLNLPIRVIREPFLRGPEVTLVNALDIPADPAGSAQGMHFVPDLPGDAPAPARLRLTGKTGNIRYVRVAWTPFTDPTAYIAGPLWTQTTAASGRGWTSTNGDDTSTISDATASGGSTAECNFATFVSGSGYRVQLTRTAANMTPFRGKTVDVWVRVSATVVQDYRLGLTLRTTDGGDGSLLFSAEEVVYRPQSTGNVYTWVKLARVAFPDQPLDGVRWRLPASAESSAGRLRLDVMAVLPSDHAVRMGNDQTFFHLTSSGQHMDSIPDEGRLVLLSPAGDFQRDLSYIEGQLPLTLSPGKSLVTLLMGANFTGSPAEPLSTLGDVLTATVTCSPRYLT